MQHALLRANQVDSPHDNATLSQTDRKSAQPATSRLSTANVGSVATHRDASLLRPSLVPLVQRKCACAGSSGSTGECADCQLKQLQRRSSSAQAAPTIAPPIVHQVLRSSGQPLDPVTRASMEPHFERDLSDVRIHTDAQATSSARAVNALAYTVGNRIVFDHDHYRPQTTTGQHLLAHELTHVIQQSGSSTLPTSLQVGSPDDYAERQADSVANQVTARANSSPPDAAVATQQTVQKQGGMPIVRRAVSDLCASPGAFFDFPTAAAFGILAHKLVEQDYETEMGVTPPADVYFDDAFAGPIDPDYVAFIVRKNPGMPAWQVVLLSVQSVNRPDILLHDAGHQEYEETKPDSMMGELSGQIKLAFIEDYMTRLGLPYVRGTSYTPSPTIPILSTTVAGIPVEFFLSLRRGDDGLILYQLCIRTDWLKVTLLAVLIALIIILIALLGDEIEIPIPEPGEPLPDPAEPFPPELPAPSPVPSPIPSPTPVPVPVPVPGLGSSSGITPGGVAGGSTATTVTPTPYSGSITGGFRFSYVSGLPSSPAVGTTYAVTISYQDAGDIFVSTVDFQVIGVSGGIVDLRSANSTPINVSPPGRTPHIIDVNTPAHIPLTRLATP